MVAFSVAKYHEIQKSRTCVFPSRQIQSRHGKLDVFVLPTAQYQSIPDDEDEFFTHRYLPIRILVEIDCVVRSVK